MRTGIVLLCTLVGCWIQDGRSRADDWPQFRGPGRDGVSRETGLLKSWPEGGPRLLWSTDKLGIGYSGPAAVGALKVAGSHSSKETTCAVPGVSSSPIQPANRKQQTAKPSFDSVFVMDLFPFVSTVARETAGSVTYAAVWISRAIFAATLADACEDVNPCCPHLSPKFSPFLNY